MAFLFPQIAPPKKRRGPEKKCKRCYEVATKGFTKGPNGEWYHVGCIDDVVFELCPLCDTVINKDDGEESVFDGHSLRCRSCYEDELTNRKHQCIKRDCLKTAVVEVNDGFWFCRKHIPDRPFLVVSLGGKNITN